MNGRSLCWAKCGEGCLPTGKQKHEQGPLLASSPALRLMERGGLTASGEKRAEMMERVTVGDCDRGETA